MTDDDGRWREGQAIEVRFPLAGTEVPPGLPPDEQAALLKAEHERWPWLTGEIESQCGPGEWEVVVYDDRLAALEDGSPAPEGTPGEDLYYPKCFRGSSEIREPQLEARAEVPDLPDSALPAAADYVRRVANELEELQAAKARAAEPEQLEAGQ